MWERVTHRKSWEGQPRAKRHRGGSAWWDPVTRTEVLERFLSLRQGTCRLGDGVSGGGLLFRWMTDLKERRGFVWGGQDCREFFTSEMKRKTGNSLFFYSLKFRDDRCPFPCNCLKFYRWSEVFLFLWKPKRNAGALCFKSLRSKETWRSSLKDVLSEIFGSEKKKKGHWWMNTGWLPTTFLRQVRKVYRPTRSPWHSTCTTQGRTECRCIGVPLSRRPPRPVLRDRPMPWAGRRGSTFPILGPGDVRTDTHEGRSNSLSELHQSL